MATFAAVITTSAPSSPAIYARVLTGTVAAPATSVARSLMTAQVTVGGTSVWELYVSAWDNSWVAPRVVIDDGVTCWCDGYVIANLVQVSGTATSLGSISGTQSITVESTAIAVTDA